MAFQGRWRHRGKGYDFQKYDYHDGGGHQRNYDSWLVQWRAKLHSVCVNNLSCKVNNRALLDAFSDYEKVADVYIHRPNDEKRRKGPVTFGFVRYWREYEATAAFVGANNRFLEGSRIRTSKVIPTRSNISMPRQEGKNDPHKKENKVEFREARVDGRTFRDVTASTTLEVRRNHQLAEKKLNKETEALSSIGERRRDHRSLMLEEVVETSHVLKDEEIDELNEVSSSSSSSNHNFSMKKVDYVDLNFDLPPEDRISFKGSYGCRRMEKIHVCDKSLVDSNFSEELRPSGYSSGNVNGLSDDCSSSAKITDGPQLSLGSSKLVNDVSVDIVHDTLVIVEHENISKGRAALTLEEEQMGDGGFIVENSYYMGIII
ncbi:hypothetical protein COLO4_10226 [Corchorus olitorius]|uniref:RRM domain-containing protein n=1 Tax=Corchorus olitorius TaxID=93759 RepID=A0A1R3K9J6_9ROSI|nr:hypothetical protein COLO4_10226 [Corchorus olitorius]